MEFTLPDSERDCLPQAQRACRGQAGYVPVTVLLLLDQGHAAATVAQALGMEASSVYRYAQTYQLHGLAGYLRAEHSGYWGLLTSAQLAGLRRKLGQQLYTDCRVIADGLAATYGVRYSVSGLTDLLHRLGANALVAYSYKLTTFVPCQADAAAQTAFITDTLAPLRFQAGALVAVMPLLVLLTQVLMGLFSQVPQAKCDLLLGSRRPLVPNGSSAKNKFSGSGSR